MNSPRMRRCRTDRAAGAHRPAVVALVAVLAILAGAAPAFAFWTSTGSTSATTTTGTLAPPGGVTVPATAAADVPVIWARGSGGVNPAGYFVTRRIGATTAAACASSPGTLIEATSCVDTGVPEGQYSYVVTAVYASWTAASTPSGSVTVAAASFLGAAQAFSVLAGTAVVNTGPTVVSGDLGVSPATSITGFGPGIVGGDIHAGDATAAAAQTALNTAYNDLAVRPAGTEITLDLGGTTVPPGVYHSTAALAVTGTLTLDGLNNPDAVFVFQTGAAFNTAAASHVTLINGANAANVFWVAGGAVTTGADSFLSGTVLTQAAITLSANTVLIGRALSRTAVTLAANIIRFTDAPAPTITIDDGASAVTKDTTPTLTGTSDAPPGSRVTVTIAGQTLATTVASNGTWTVTTADLIAGSYAVVAKVRAPSGNGTAAFQTLTVEVNPAILALGAAATYSVLAGTAVVNTGSTHLTGDLGVSPADSVSGFPPGTLGGVIHAADSAAAEAQDALAAALADGFARVPHAEVVGDLGGRTLHIGVHHSNAALAVTGTLTLDGENNPDAVFVFQTGAAFNTAAASHVNLINGAQAANVFWVVGGAVTTGANSFLSGTVLAQGAITVGASTALAGQVLSRGTVTLAGSTLTGVAPAPIIASRTAAPPTLSPSPVPSTTPSTPSADLSATPSAAPSAAPGAEASASPGTEASATPGTEALPTETTVR